MLKIAQGVTRIVLILPDRVIKFPNPFNGWIPFLQGFVSNHIEGTTWVGEQLLGDQGDCHKLCPIMAFSFNGFWLVMKRARTLPEGTDLKDLEGLENLGDITEDLHAANLGYLDDRLVVIDYG